MFHAGGLVTVLRNCVSVVDRTSSSFSLSSPSSACPDQLCREAERRRATGIILGPHHAAKLMKYKNGERGFFCVNSVHIHTNVRDEALSFFLPFRQRLGSVFGEAGHTHRIPGVMFLFHALLYFLSTLYSSTPV